MFVLHIITQGFLQVMQPEVQRLWPPRFLQINWCVQSISVASLTPSSTDISNQIQTAKFHSSRLQASSFKLKPDNFLQRLYLYRPTHPPVSRVEGWHLASLPCQWILQRPRHPRRRRHCHGSDHGRAAHLACLLSIATVSNQPNLPCPSTFLISPEPCLPHPTHCDQGGWEGEFILFKVVYYGLTFVLQEVEEEAEAEAKEEAKIEEIVDEEEKDEKGQGEGNFERGTDRFSSVERNPGHTLKLTLLYKCIKKLLHSFLHPLAQISCTITDIWNKVSLSSRIPESLNGISTRLRYLYWGAKSGVASVTGALHCRMSVEAATPNNINKSTTPSTIISQLRILFGFQLESYLPFKTNSSSILTPQKTSTSDMRLIVLLTNKLVLSTSLSRNLRYPPASKCVADLISVKMLKVGEVIPGDCQGIRKWALRNLWSIKCEIGKWW